MKHQRDPSPKPGALAAMLAMLADPDRPAKLTLVHSPYCSTRRGEQCDCRPEIKRGSND